jgi:hypothetical protein
VGGIAEQLPPPAKFFYEFGAAFKPTAIKNAYWLCFPSKKLSYPLAPMVRLSAKGYLYPCRGYPPGFLVSIIVSNSYPVPSCSGCLGKGAPTRCQDKNGMG